MGIEDATDWITAVKGTPAYPPLPGGRRRITRIGAPVARQPSGPATVTQDTRGNGGGSCTTREKGDAVPTQGDD